MSLQYIPLTLEELTDETAATISGGFGIFDLQTSANNGYRSPFDKYLRGSNTGDDTESTEENLQQASNSIQGTEALAKTIKILF
ncbi:hypothetical protein AMR41_05355 [Hapalosiphon sp. MRB220]|nr:hypothetical protein AMR41_05355 [Hapalosiphon sp. MRB220]